MQNRWVEALKKKYTDKGGSPNDYTGPQSLSKGLPRLDLATTKDFLRFHVAVSRGRLEKRITVDSTRQILTNQIAYWGLGIFHSRLQSLKF